MTFSAAESDACQRLVDIAWEEDLGPRQDPFQTPQADPTRQRIIPKYFENLVKPGFAGPAADLTTQALIPLERHGQAVFVARAPGVVAGLPAVELVLRTANTPLVKFQALVEDGTPVQPGDRLATVTGLMQCILMAERVALNFLQHLSGVASLTRRYVDAVAGLDCRILDTRKTTPGWRLLEKYAVRCGGGHNHRLGLYDGILIKDNHLAILGVGKEVFLSVGQALRGHFPFPLEIEVDTLEQLDWALACSADIVLLDNMIPEQLREAVRRRNERGPRVLLEASGGVTLETVRAIAETGVDRISVGALTHSAPALDIALDYVAE